MSLNAVIIFFEIVVLILAFSVHECAHAWMASRLGDQTARLQLHLLTLVEPERLILA